MRWTINCICPPTIIRFLSSNTQDFIEVKDMLPMSAEYHAQFLSSNTQDFIEVQCPECHGKGFAQFLSSNTQDFIEVRTTRNSRNTRADS